MKAKNIGGSLTGKCVKKDGMLVAEVVIPHAHEALVKSLTA